MMLRQALIVTVIALLLCPGIGRAEQFRPSNYDECITDSMKGVGSDVAARAIIASCRNQFPSSAPTETQQDEHIPAPVAPVAPVAQQEQPPAEARPQQEKSAPATSRSLTSGELKKLKSSAFILADSYRVTIENMNENVTVTEVTIDVWHTSKPDERRSYIRPVMVLPQGTGRVTFKDVVPNMQDDGTWSDGSKVKWGIVSATGSDQIPH